MLHSNEKDPAHSLSSCLSYQQRSQLSSVKGLKKQSYCTLILSELLLDSQQAWGKLLWMQSDWEAQTGTSMPNGQSHVCSFSMRGEWFPVRCIQGSLVGGKQSIKIMDPRIMGRHHTELKINQCLPQTWCLLFIIFQHWNLQSVKHPSLHSVTFSLKRLWIQIYQKMSCSATVTDKRRMKVELQLKMDWTMKIWREIGSRFGVNLYIWQPDS